MAELDLNGILNLHYGVHPGFRRNPKHYGTEILVESAKYIFKNMKFVKRIELFIKEINKGSIQCAEKAGYHLTRKIEPKNGDGKVKVYSKSR